MFGIGINSSVGAPPLEGGYAFYSLLPPSESYRSTEMMSTIAGSKSERRFPGGFHSPKLLTGVDILQISPPREWDCLDQFKRIHL